MSDERRAATQEIPGPALQGGAAGERTLGTQGALLLVLGTAPVASVPLLFVDVPPMLDYSNHLARIHLIELPLYVPVLWWMAHRWGIEGAAIAWMLRGTVDVLVQLWVAERLMPRSAHEP